MDDSRNRNLGRVGMPVGSMPVSRSGDGASSSKTYVDNDSNRRLGREGMEHGSMVVSKSSSDCSSQGSQHSVKEKHGPVGLPHCAHADEVRVYKDNPSNVRLGRVGLPVGSAVQSKSCTKFVHQYYADNSQNHRLGRVGFPLGSLPRSSRSGSKRTYADNYLNRKRDRVGKELGTQHVSCSKETEWLNKAYRRYRENPVRTFDFIVYLHNEIAWLIMNY